MSLVDLDFDSPRDLPKLGDEIPFRCWWNLSGVFERSGHSIHLSPSFTHFHEDLETLFVSHWPHNLSQPEFSLPGAENAEFSDGQRIPES